MNAGKVRKLSYDLKICFITNLILESIESGRYLHIPNQITQSTRRSSEHASESDLAQCFSNNICLNISHQIRTELNIQIQADGREIPLLEFTLVSRESKQKMEFEKRKKVELN